MDAANHLAEYFARACIKTVKLKEFPSLLELTKQLELINASFEDVCSQGKTLTIRLQRCEGEKEKECTAEEEEKK